MAGPTKSSTVNLVERSHTSGISLDQHASERCRVRVGHGSSGEQWEGKDYITEVRVKNLKEAKAMTNFAVYSECEKDNCINIRFCVIYLPHFLVNFLAFTTM